MTTVTHTSGSHRPSGRITAPSTDPAPLDPESHEDRSTVDVAPKVDGMGRRSSGAHKV